MPFPNPEAKSTAEPARLLPACFDTESSPHPARTITVNSPTRHFQNHISCSFGLKKKSSEKPSILSGASLSTSITANYQNPCIKAPFLSHECYRAPSGNFVQLHVFF
jgi:hypothetical protein